MNSNTLHLTDTTFDQHVLQASGPAVVDFWAEWCAPCRAMGPTIDAIATETSGRATVGKVDTQAFPELAQSYGVQSIPTLIFFRDGVETDRIVGVVTKGEIEERLAKSAAGNGAAGA